MCILPLPLGEDVSASGYVGAGINTDDTLELFGGISASIGMERLSVGALASNSPKMQDKVEVSAAFASGGAVVESNRLVNNCILLVSNRFRDHRFRPISRLRRLRPIQAKMS